MITGGSFANNTLTLNRASGNLQIGGFTSGGAQSVDVSLSGSTLTVNVDGHSDSVDIAALNPLSGSINLSIFEPETNEIYITPEIYTPSQNSDDSSYTTKTVSINNLNINSVGNGFGQEWYDFSGGLNAYHISFDTTNITYNLSGSGTIIFKELGFVVPVNNYTIYSESATIPDAMIKIDNGIIVDMNFPEQLYMRSWSRFYVTSKNIYIQY